VIVLLVAAAQAASPGGFRVDPGVPVDMVQLRQVVGVFPGRFTLAQTAVRGQIVLGRLGLDAQVPYVHVQSGGWTDDGMGQLRLGARRWAGTRDRPVSYGVEVAFPCVPPALRVSAWGSAARETLPGLEAVMFLELATSPGRPITFRAALGWYGGPTYESGSVVPALDLALAHVQPVRGRLSAVGELELTSDVSWLSARGLARIDASEAWGFDLGLQLPVFAYLDREEQGWPQLIGQARAFW
jgi:hypothetical protein